MTRRSLLVLAALVFGIFAQVSENVAGKDAARAVVKGRTLISESLPPLRLKFDGDFKYAGMQALNLNGNAQAEQHFFVDTEKGKSIKRLFMVQIEGFLPTNNYTYNYRIADTVQLGEHEYMTDASFGKLSVIRKGRPDSDVSKAIAYLELQGFRFKSDEFMSRRFVRVVDDAQRNEIIIVYAESLSETGWTLAALSEAGRSAEWERLAAGLQTRALKSFKVVKD